MSGRADPAPQRVWITRAQPGADVTAERVRALGWTPVVAPLIETQALDHADLDLAGVDALAFTSAAGVRAFAGLHAERALPVFAVGAATAQAATDAGFTQVVSADGDVRALAARLAGATPRPSRVLYPSAAEPAADLSALLANTDIDLRQVPVYHSVDTGLAAAPPDLAAILIHSPRAAAAALPRLRGLDLAATVLIAISPAAAHPLAGLAFKAARIAETPDEAALLRQLGPGPRIAP